MENQKDKVQQQQDRKGKIQPTSLASDTPDVVIMSGYLHKLKRSKSNMFSSDWSRRFFSIEGNSMKYYTSKKSFTAGIFTGGSSNPLSQDMMF